MKRILPFAFALLLPIGMVMACPMCKDSIPSTDAQNFQSIPAAYNWSVYLFLGGLFSMIGMVSVVVVKGINSTPMPRGFTPLPPRASAKPKSTDESPKSDPPTQS